MEMEREYNTRVSFLLIFGFPEFQNTSVLCHGVCSRLLVLAWLEKKTHEGEGRGPNRPKGLANGEQTTYIMKIWQKATANGEKIAERRPQMVCKQTPKNFKLTIYAETCEGDENGGNTAQILVSFAETCTEKMRAPSCIEQVL